MAEINRSNPIGKGGKVADAYASLVKGNSLGKLPIELSIAATAELWFGDSTKFNPRAFVSTIQSLAADFTPGQQHDSQEFIAFLLDALHEDLNRVLKKPCACSRVALTRVLLIARAGADTSPMRRALGDQTRKSLSSIGATISSATNRS